MQIINKILKGINANFIKSNAQKMKDQDINKVFEKADEIEKKFQKNSSLERFITDGKLLLAIVKDYRKGNYKKIPYWMIGAIVFTLLYVLNPLDAIFDVLPLIGYVDDATAVGICLYLIEHELQEYKKWKDTMSS